MIIAAFAGTGKTYFCNYVEGAKDFVCMPYKYFMPNIINGDMEDEKIKADFSLEMNPEYPQNYINAILENMEKYKYLVIPSDSRVLAGLEGRHIPYILCYPLRSSKEKYRKRYMQRGNTGDFIDIFIGCWDHFIKSLQQDAYGAKIILAEEEYLLDAKEKMDRIILSGEIPIQEYRIT